MSSTRRTRGTTPQPRKDQTQDSTFNASMSSQASSASQIRSPFVAQRIEEKEFLATCNNKLAAYIDRNRHLEQENARVTTQLTTIQTTHVEETKQIRQIYETELKDTRETLDRVSKTHAQLQLEHSKMKTEFDDIKKRLAHTSSELDAAVKRADANESKVADAQRKAQEADHVRQVAVKENQDLKRDKKALEKQLADLARQMEEETMARVEAQNALQSTVERNQFKENLHQQEIAELRSFQETHTTKITKELEEEYDCRLEEALENMRSQYGAQMDEIRESAERKNADKIQEMKQHIERLVNESKKTRAEWSVMKTRYDDSQSQVTQMQKQNQHLQQQLRDAENGAEQLRIERDRMIEEMQAEIDALKAELAQIRDERQELIESRISLDLELQAYRKMLDAEEERLSPHSLSRPRKRARRDGTGTPSTTKTTTTHETSRVEQRTEVRMTAHQHVSGAIEITDIDPDGRFVRLANVSDHDVAMSGWQFKISSGSGEAEVSHKFGRSFSLNPQGSCTVWANSKVAPNPMDDHDVLARPNTVRFPAPSVDYPTVRVVLSDSGPNAKVVADVEVKRETVIVGNEHTAGGSPNKNCLIM